MTAIAIPYSSFGFAIAADGRQRWGHQPSRDALIRASESDEVQKIFPVERREAVFAYTVSGDVAGRDRSFDLAREVGEQLRQMQRNRFLTMRRFLEALARRMETSIHVALEEERIEEYPNCEITFVGYFRGRPVLSNIQFQHRREVLQWRTSIRPPVPGSCHYTGSPIIAELVSHGDPRFSGFCAPLDENGSLQAATEHAIGYIRASCSDLSRFFDPHWDGIGGRIHAATVTPPNRSIGAKVRSWLRCSPASHGGFRWIIPPHGTVLPSPTHGQ
jgi:hypothetical protein